MSTLNRHALVAATARAAVAQAVPTGDAMLVAAADMFCAVVSGS